MKQVFSLLLCLALIPIYLLAQNKQATGLILDDAAYENLPLAKKKASSKYPIAADKSLKKFCPIPGKQGDLSSCVGWALGYHAMTITKAIEDTITTLSDIEYSVYSASYIFNQVKQDSDCDVGISLTKGLSFLKCYGTPPAMAFNNSVSNCTMQPDATARDIATENKIKDFYPIFKTGTIDSIKIEDTKLWLSRNKPIIIGINLTDDFWNIKEGQQLWSPNLTQRSPDYHVMVVVGYENKGHTGEFELLNSYGPTWGNDGFIKIKYEDYGKLVKYAFVIDSIGGGEEDMLSYMLQSNGDIALGTRSNRPDLSSTVLLQQLQLRADDSYYFTQKEVRYNPVQQQYQPMETWHRESQYQLIIKNLFAGRHLYAFSFNAQQEVYSIWPSNDPLEKWKGLQQMEITIPWETDVLELTYSGKDYVVLLYSNQEFTNFKAYLQQFRTTTGTFQERMKQVFGKLLIDEKLVNYQYNELHFDCAAQEAYQRMIPFILAFEVE